jgi:hypothetical protein
MVKFRAPREKLHPLTLSFSAPISEAPRIARRLPATRGVDMSQNASLVPLFSETEAARLLGLAVPTLRKWRWAGKGPVWRKIGACVRYSEADVAAFIADSRRRSTSDPGPDASGGGAP